MIHECDEMRVTDRGVEKCRAPAAAFKIRPPLPDRFYCRWHAPDEGVLPIQVRTSPRSGEE